MTQNTNQPSYGRIYVNQPAYDRLMVPWVDRSYSLARIFCLRTCTSAAAAVAMHSYSPEYDGDGTLDLGYLNIGGQNSIHTRVPQIDQKSEFRRISKTTGFFMLEEPSKQPYRHINDILPRSPSILYFYFIITMGTD